MKKAAIYIRISQDATGQRAGVTRQQEDCLALAETLKWKVVATYDDNDISAYSGKRRPGFEALLAAIDGGDIDAVVCWHPDRLYRRVRDLERLVDITDKVSIRTVNAGELDLSKATGKMMARIIGSVSEMESEHKGERRRRANAQRAANGDWRADGGRIFGYTNTGEPLEPEATAVRQAAADVLDKVSLRSIANGWNAKGITTVRGKQWSNLTLRRMLMNPTYAGLRTYQGKQIGSGNWEALINPDMHRGLVALLSDPSRRPATSFERRHLGSGIYECGECGGKMYAMRPGSQGSHRSMVYACRSGGHVARVAAPVDEMIEQTVLGVLGSTDIADRLRSDDGVDIAGLHCQRAALQARLDELAALFADGVIDGSQLKTGTFKLRADVADIDRQLTEAMRASTAAKVLRDGPEKIAEHWQALSQDMRGKIVDELMTVTIRKSARGRRVFDPELVVITPKVTTS